MMVDLVPLAQVKLALRIDHSHEDEVLRLMIEAASNYIIKYLKDGAAVFLDDSGEIIYENVPAEVRWATIFYVGWLYRNRDSDQDKELVALGYPPTPVVSLLHQLRDPAIA